ncbi:YchJ family protein [Nocardiopsis quinghaiensis]|uniref:YchJ family protein n=1 Tax=Nocardiopsis quinghaiensis TaxID=464995 RepID=UPI00123ACAA9|nr:YchJ family metal-binding protein [Nocardiopsis quinghaiensis]
MSQRRPRHRQPPPAADAAAPCPCGGSAAYRDCCGRLHRGEAPASTAEQLMRSRYSAFAVGDRDHLLRTWHPSTRPRRLDPDPGTEWVRLEILSTTGGTPFHSEGTVAFRAVYRESGQEEALEEHSRFVRHEGAWVYLDALPD